MNDSFLIIKLQPAQAKDLQHRPELIDTYALLQKISLSIEDYNLRHNSGPLKITIEACGDVYSIEETIGIVNDSCRSERNYWVQL